MKIGLMLPLADDDGLGRAPTWPELRELALTAESAGLDSIWGADHLVFKDEDGLHGIRECWTVLTAVAALTERVEIGPLVLALPFRNPALTAKMAAELDSVSNGRLVLGLGCGWHEPEFDAFDYPFDHRVGRFEEGLDIVLPLLAGRSRGLRRHAGTAPTRPCFRRVRAPAVRRSSSPAKAPACSPSSPGTRTPGTPPGTGRRRRRRSSTRAWRVSAPPARSRVGTPRRSR